MGESGRYVMIATDKPGVYVKKLVEEQTAAWFAKKPYLKREIYGMDALGNVLRDAVNEIDYRARGRDGWWDVEMGVPRIERTVRNGVWRLASSA